MDPSRPGKNSIIETQKPKTNQQNFSGDASDFVSWQAGPSGINMSPRMNPPRGPGMGPMGGYGPAMRGPPPNSMPTMSITGRPQWPSTSQPMNYSSSSPGNYGVSDVIVYIFLFPSSKFHKSLILTAVTFVR